MSIGKDSLHSLFETTFGKASNVNYYFCPGRVCLIGEHLDYNGGHVLPTAVSLGIYAAVSKNSGNIIRCKSQSFENEVIIKLSEDIFPKNEDPWGNYIRGVVSYLQNTGVKIPGLDIYFASNLPHGAGLSSSAAIEVLTTFLILSETDEPIDLEKISLLCKDVENDFVGMKCGIMDQFTVALSKPNQAILLNCDNLNMSYVPVDTGDYKFIIINSNVPRSLTNSAFNTRRQECEQALAELNKKFGITSLAEATFEQVNSVGQDSPRKRAIHVVSENKRVIEAKNVLEKGDILRFGQLMKESHQSLKEFYEVTGPELDSIAENAWSIDGCIGARMTGAGFSGCCIALVKNDHIESFKETLGQRYLSQHPTPLSFHEFEMNGGVRTFQKQKFT